LVDDLEARSDGDFAYVAANEDGAQERHLPLRNAAVVWAANRWLEKTATTSPFDERCTFAWRVPATAAAPGVELELGAEKPAAWAEHDVAIHTYPRGSGEGIPGARRYGVFCGVADYQFNADRERASKGKAHLNLPACHRDARQLVEVLREVSQLSDLRFYTNELATRRATALTARVSRMTNDGGLGESGTDADPLIQFANRSCFPDDDDSLWRGCSPPPRCPGRSISVRRPRYDNPDPSGGFLFVVA
jgi:hypothetical protein